MKLVDFGGIHYVEAIAELESLLAIRYPPGFNDFWLTDSPSGFPTLNIMARDDLANLHYFETSEDVGVQSNGHMNLPGAYTIFSMCEGDRTEVDNDAVVPFSLAIVAAKEFMICQRLPTHVEWCEV